MIQEPIGNKLGHIYKMGGFTSYEMIKGVKGVKNNKYKYKYKK